MHISATRWRFTLTLCLLPLVTGACASAGVPDGSTCRHLDYKEGGLSRSEYLPCAGEIVAALDELGRQTQAASKGDRQARTDGRAALARVSALMDAAGGRNLLERWQDRALTDLNVKIHNAVTHYEAFYMVRVVDEPEQFAASSRAAAESELRAALRRHDEARSSYRRLR
jgi:hypothetical protein